MSRRILLSGYYGFANAGDEAVLAGLLLSLRAGDTSAQLNVLSINPAETTATHTVRALHRYHPQALLPAIARTDVLLSGGGSLLQDVTSAHGIFYYLGVVRAAQMLGKKTMFVAQGIGPLRRSRTRALVAGVANKLSAITVRDEASADLLREIGVTRPPIEVTADPALLLGPELLPHPDTNAFGVALRPWPGQAGLAARVADACQIAFPEGQPCLLPMQPGSDTTPAEQFAAQWHQEERAVFCFPETGLDAIVQSIGACQLIVGMRLHALILAAACGVPSAALSYDPKVAAFMAQSGQADAVYDLAQPPDELAPLLARVWGAREARAEALRARLPTLREAARRNAAVALSLLP